MDSNQNEVELDVSPDAVLKIVQTTRLKGLLKIGEPLEKNDRYLMNELAETAVQCKKIESDEKVSGDDRDMAAALARVIATMGPNPFHKDNLGITRNTVLDVEVPVITPVPGEAGLEMEVLDYNDFVKTNKK